MNENPSSFEESAAFDERMRQRIANGHIPDLRRTQFTPWFYNNPWRHPHFVDTVLGKYYKFVRDHMPFNGARVLEIGSGPGHITLELARNGFYVTGLELSPYSVDVARQLAEENPYTDGFGSIDYICEDFLVWETTEKFDAVYFLLSLHHFEDIDLVLERSQKLLNPGGVFIAIEPAREWLSSTEMALVSLIRLLLSNYKGWHETLLIPKTFDEIDSLINKTLVEYQEARDNDETLQSPNDNSSHASEMVSGLRKHFDEITYQKGFSFLPRVIGGIRGTDEKQIMNTADLLTLFDEYFVSRGILQPGVYYFAGKLHSS